MMVNVGQQTTTSNLDILMVKKINKPKQNSWLGKHLNKVHAFISVVVEDSLEQNN